MKISCCMIVRNEAENLEKTLNAAVKYFDELVIVDTGSIDNSKEIAGKYTKSVYDFTWANDFSAARNFSISKAKNDNIFILDADEEITSFDVSGFYNILYKDMKIGRIKIRNFIENGQVYVDKVSRFFNRKEFHYEGRIHEQLVSLNGDKVHAVDLDIVIDHVGYKKENIKKAGKIDRNISLLMQNIDNSPMDPYLYYQLGKSYSLQGSYLKAKESYETSLKFITDFRYEYTGDLIISYGYSLINLGLYNEALSLEKYNENYSWLADYCFLMGLVYMNNACFDNAILSFKSCIDKKVSYIEGICSFLPSYNIGIILECLGMTDEAISWYKACNGYIKAEERLSALVSRK